MRLHIAQTVAHGLWTIGELLWRVADAIGLAERAVNRSADVVRDGGHWIYDQFERRHADKERRA